MKIIRAKDYYDMSRKAANIISAQVIMKPNCVLGLATGGTPVGTYKQLVEWYNKGDVYKRQAGDHRARAHRKNRERAQPAPAGRSAHHGRKV